MKLEAGKFYKTRDGRKVEIVKTGLSSLYGIHSVVGIIFDDRFDWRTTSYQPNGLYTITPGVIDHSCLDIVEEWKEPKVVKVTAYALVWPDGNTVIMDNLDIARNTMALYKDEAKLITLEDEVTFND